MLSHQVDNEIEMRLLQPQHAQSLFALVDSNRNYLREWLPWLDKNIQQKDSLSFINNNLKIFAESQAFVCGIWHDGALVGVIGHNRIDWLNRISFPGYWLAQHAQGKGIMTKCCQALVQHAFAELGLNRVVITVAIGNQPSKAIPERLGFTREGVLRDAEWLYDRYVDHVIYGLLRRDKN